MIKRATYDDVLAAPENKVAEILGRGRGGPGGWRILDALPLALGDLWADLPTAADRPPPSAG